MPGLLLGTDFHLDDQPQNEYRWTIFDEMAAAGKKRKITRFYILGDITDAKNRFSAALVNRLVAALIKLSDIADVHILAGNHDKPLKGPYFFDFLNEIAGIAYYSNPYLDEENGLLLLPFAANPRSEWNGIRFGDFKAAFLHATVSGAIAENGTTMTGTKLPLIPRAVKIYSGDVHTAQQAGNVTYIGCPFPIKFGDKFKNRMLVLNENTYEIDEEILLDPPGKRVFGISSVADLDSLQVKAGDQVKLVYDMAIDDLDKWGAAEAAIADWAREKGVLVAGTDVVLPQPRLRDTGDLELSPEQVLADFCEAERISDDAAEIGRALLKETRK